MEFEGSEVVLFHGVVDLRKGAAGLLGLIEKPELGTWYLFSNRTRSLMKCVRMDRSGVWMGSRRLKQGRYLWVERSRGSSVLSASAAKELCAGKKPKIYHSHPIGMSQKVKKWLALGGFRPRKPV